MRLTDIPPSTWAELRRLAVEAGKPDVAAAIDEILFAPLQMALRRREDGSWEAGNDCGRLWRFASSASGLQLLGRLLAGESVRLDPAEVEGQRLACKRALDALRSNGCSKLAARLASAIVFKRDGRVIYSP